MNRNLDRLRSERNGLRSMDDREWDLPTPCAKPGGRESFITFRYASTEIYSDGGHIHMKVQETRFQDGRLTSEECEATLDQRAYERFAREAQSYFMNQAGNFLKLLFAPFGSQTRHGRDD